ncbi:hypothetical protein N9891_01510 [bacterium]|nr:hypothetical protein [bacterium]
MIHLSIGSNNALQLFAWSKMFVDYSAERSLTEAAEMTFDGEHPCPLCAAIAETRKEEKEEPAAPREQGKERDELFPQAPIVIKSRGFTKAKVGPPSPTPLLTDARFVPELPTPPPQLGEWRKA